MGQLVTAFNVITGKLRSLIKNIVENSEQVASVSDELSASSEQSSQSAVQVAATITEVAQGAHKQLERINKASSVIEALVNEISQVVSNAEIVSKTTASTAETAQDGDKSVEAAISQMTNI